MYHKIHRGDDCKNVLALSKQFSCTVICSNCKHKAYKDYYGGENFLITDSYNAIMNAFPLCAQCGNDSFEIVDVKIRSLKHSEISEFGHNYNGRWLCPKGHGGVFYILMIIKGFEGKLDDTEQSYAKKYEALSKRGYPPRCPECNDYLIYTEQ